MRNIQINKYRKYKYMGKYTLLKINKTGPIVVSIVRYADIKKSSCCRNKGSLVALLLSPEVQQSLTKGAT